MQIEAATLTRQGARDHNEDRFGHWAGGSHAVWLVADGAGGHGGGDVAAQVVCDTIVAGFAAQPTLDPAQLRELVLRANASVITRQHEGGRLADMRSTVVMVAFDLVAGRMVWAHSGDSRAYLFRQQAIVARTTDHSLVQQMVASGMIDDETARQHPQRSILLSALGTDVDELEITVSGPMRLAPGDEVMLCSDGIWEVLGDQRLIACVAGSGSARQWAAEVEQAVLAADKHEQDNFTGLFLRIQSDDVHESAIVATGQPGT
ncbi:MAG: PP2C family serine/threonine-protein phosphatase [Ottowia sp.]|nr:serine/threonine-protein phosphatase [Ottowia sp.]